MLCDTILFPNFKRQNNKVVLTFRDVYAIGFFHTHDGISPSLLPTKQNTK